MVNNSDFETLLEPVKPHHTQPETPLEHYWFNLGHQSNKIAEENNLLRLRLKDAEEVLLNYANADDVGAAARKYFRRKEGGGV